MKLAIVLAPLIGMMPLALEASCFGATSSKEVYKFSVVPQLPGDKILSTWGPVLDMVGKASNMCFDVIVEQTITNFERGLISGDPDFAFVNPYHAYLSFENAGYDSIIVDSHRKLTGILVVQAESDITSIDQLDGAAIAFPSPNAFGASLLIQSFLTQNNISYSPVYRATHSDVYRSVALGLNKAAGGVNNTLDRERVEVQNALRVLHQTEGYVAHPIIAHPRVPKEAIDKFVSEFLLLASKSQHKEAFDAIQIPAPRKSEYVKDFAPLQELNLDAFVELFEKVK